MPVSAFQESWMLAFVRSFPSDHLFLTPDQIPASGEVLVTRNGMRVRLHRYLYRMAIGDLASNEYLIRNCGADDCFNPHHYRVVRSARAAQTHCPNGHEYTEEDRGPDGTHTCHVCQVAARLRRHTGAGVPNHVIEKARQFCPHGHHYSPENTYTYVNRKGSTYRKCRTCTIMRSAGIDPASVT